MVCAGVSDASTAVNAGETENPVSDDAPDNEIDITNEKRIGVSRRLVFTMRTLLSMIAVETVGGS